MEIKLGIGVLESYQRLSYKVWYALAEFIDNSTQSYENAKDLLDPVFDNEGDMLTVTIDFRNGKDGFIVVEDNSIGMDDEDLQYAFTLGKRPKDTTGRSKYGLGLKTAAFWFGNKWEIVTTKLGSKLESTVTVDLKSMLSEATKNEVVKKARGQKGEAVTEVQGEKVIQRENILKVTHRVVKEEDHYTSIRITDLNRNIHHKTERKTKEFLRSMYRYDLQQGKLLLFFRGERLSWSPDEFKSRMLKDENDVPYFREFTPFEINNKRVSGWAGVLETGSRKDAGFSILQSHRVIKGWPDSYRPEKLFGEQEGGINNLVNQRLVGELFLDDFDVSHTKDEILFHGDEEDELDKRLFEELADLKRVAQDYRKPKDGSDEDGEEDVDVGVIIKTLFQKIQQPEFTGKVKKTVLPPDVIMEMEESYIKTILNNDPKEVYEATVAGIKITVIINSDGSIYEPYVVYRSRARKDSITVVINKNHQHWKTLKSSDLVIYFIKQCIYDAIAEWKANFIVGSLDPDTIKIIKDDFLRMEVDLT